MKIKNKFISILIFAFFIACFFLINVCYANILNDWKDSRAYRPSPVLFLHGFASGSPQSWTDAKVDEILNQYYSKYYTGYNSDPTILIPSRYPYLEIIDFGSSLIDRNSSIDTYKAGDRYVLTGQRKAGDPGWSDKLNTAIETLRQYYINKDGSRQKITLIAHSMGGLAARKYLKSYSYANQKIDKLIMIGTPNRGSLLAATATTPYNRNRRWGWYFFPTGWVSLTSEVTVDRFLETFPKIDMRGDAVWDMDPTSTGSGFIGGLNYNYSSIVDHFAIAGRHWLAFNLGDTVASLDSQLGTGVLSLENESIINAIHWNEIKPATADIFKFLDSTKPELEITCPGPGTTEIYETSIHIQGNVYKEYLPADSQLIINVARQEGGYTPPSQISLLKPSDLWIPNNPDSPVAEFDEIVNFPGQGTYQVSLQAKNPAGEISDIKDVWVKVMVPEPPYPAPSGYHWVWGYLGYYYVDKVYQCSGVYGKAFSWDEWQNTLSFVTAKALEAREKAKENLICGWSPSSSVLVGEHTWAGPGVFGPQQNSWIQPIGVEHFTINFTLLPSMVPVYTICPQFYPTKDPWLDFTSNVTIDAPPSVMSFVDSFTVSITHLDEPFYSYQGWEGWLGENWWFVETGYRFCRLGYTLSPYVLGWILTQD